MVWAHVLTLKSPWRRRHPGWLKEGPLVDKTADPDNIIVVSTCLWRQFRQMLSEILGARLCMQQSSCEDQSRDPEKIRTPGAVVCHRYDHRVYWVVG
jgi:hypothetical protein